MTLAGKELGLMRIEPQSKQPVPLMQVMCRLQVKPVGWSLKWANKPIHWQHIMKAGDISDLMRYCSTSGSDKDKASYRYFNFDHSHIALGSN